VSELLRAGGGVKCCTLELRHPVDAETAGSPAGRRSRPGRPRLTACP
jgi:hypothetical protein